MTVRSRLDRLERQAAAAPAPEEREELAEADWSAVVAALLAPLRGEESPGLALDGAARQVFEEMRPYAEVVAGFLGRGAPPSDATSADRQARAPEPPPAPTTGGQPAAGPAGAATRGPRPPLDDGPMVIGKPRRDPLRG
jgi:hypothetical protein